jgi:hypothetical protein
MSAGGGKGGQSNEPPKYLQPHLANAADASGQMYGQGGPQQYPGNTVVPFSGQTQSGMDMMYNRAMNGSGNLREAQGLNEAMLRGDYLGGNPHLDGQIERGLQLSRTQMDSQFGGAGRNLVAQMPARSEQINNFTSDMLYKNYDAERNRQMQAMGQAPGLAAADYMDPGMAMQVGGMVEGKAGEYQGDANRRWDFEQNRPENNLDQWLARLGMNPGTGYGSQSMQGGKNDLLGAAGGGMGGALAAQALGGGFTAANPWGWAGMAAGALGGYFG